MRSSGGRDAPDYVVQSVCPSFGELRACSCTCTCFWALDLLLHMENVGPNV